MLDKFLSIFKTPPKEEVHTVELDYSVLGTDLHSHLLPGIDDGAKDMEESIFLISKLRSLGFKRLITTPHVMKGGYDNTPDIIKQKLEEVRTELARRNIDVQLEAAAEYYLDEDFSDRLDNEEILTIGGKYVLFELSYLNRPPNINSIIFKINSMGLRPMLAHVERYTYLHGESIEFFRELKEKDVYFQMNIGSLSGVYSEGVKMKAYELLEAGLIDFLGTDLHNERHYNYLKKQLKDKYFISVLQDKTFLNKEL